MQLVQYNEYWVSTVATDGLAPKRQGIDIHSA